MNSYLVTPASEAESQLLAALFKKMRVQASLVPNGVAPTARPVAKKAVKPAEFIPQNQAEHNMLEAVLELKEILAGRKEALSVEEFWLEVNAD